MYRTHTCGELRLADAGKEVVLSGWVQRVRDKGTLMWIDIRDRYGLTQLFLQEGVSSAEVIEKARTLGREFVIQAKGTVIERESKNPNIPTGEIEIQLNELNILNASKTPPFTIEDKSDGSTKQKELATKTVKSYLVPLPPFAEQLRIVQKIKFVTSIMSR